jgi:LysR family carnitine catabolism transcriptional activator
MVDVFTMFQYRAFIAVAETRSVKAAAEQLGRTPSAISMILAQLEERAGTPVFEAGRKTTLTQFGEYLFNEVRGLIEHDERVTRNIRAYADGKLGKLDIASIPSIAHVFLPDTISAIWRKFPALTMDVRDMDSRSVIEMVSAGKVEFGIGTALDLDDSLEFTALFTDPVDVVCPLHDELKGTQPVEWHMLEGRRFLGNSSYTTIQSPHVKALADRQVAYIPNITSLLALVRSGVGITLLPRINHLQAAGSVEFLTLADPQAHRTVGIVARRGHSLSPAASNFLSVLRRVVSESASSFGLRFLEQTADAVKRCMTKD